MKCPNCQVMNKDGVKYCSNCGYRMDGENPKRRVRRTFVTLLIILTAIGVAASTTAVWAHQVVFDTDRFVETVGPLIDDPNVQDALATRLSEAIMTGLEVENRVESTLTQVGPQDLPISASVLAGPITDGIRSFLHDRIQALLATDAVRTVWIKALTTAHDQAVSILRGDSSTITIQGDTAYLNLLPLVNDALSSLESTLSDLLNRQIDIPSVTGEQVDTILPATGAASGDRPSRRLRPDPGVLIGLPRHRAAGGQGRRSPGVAPDHRHRDHRDRGRCPELEPAADADVAGAGLGDRAHRRAPCRDPVPGRHRQPGAERLEPWGGGRHRLEGPREPPWVHHPPAGGHGRDRRPGLSRGPSLLALPRGRAGGRGQLARPRERRGALDRRSHPGPAHREHRRSWPCSCCSAT